MAGMDWFRWHHGSVTDPKFALVARKSGASLPDVIAVWAYVLENASQSVERGDFGVIDCEAIDCVFGFPATETRTADILKAMGDRGLVAGTQVLAWEKRQPKREREDNTSIDRQAKARDKQSQSKPSNANQNQVTPSATKKHLEEIRVEEIREEKGGNPAPEVRPVDNSPPPISQEFREVLKSRPELPDPEAVWLNFSARYPVAQQTMGQWRKWVATEHAPPHATSGFSGVTTPSATGPCEALVKLDAEAGQHRAPPGSVREKMAEILKSAGRVRAEA
jgi:hypothetical protein